MQRVNFERLHHRKKLLFKVKNPDIYAYFWGNAARERAIKPAKIFAETLWILKGQVSC